MSISLSNDAAMNGENDIWEAPDDLACLPWTYNPDTRVCGQKVDAQLSNIIKSVGVHSAAGVQGTALIIGDNCDIIIGAKHTLNEIETGKARSNKAPWQAPSLLDN